MVEETFGTSEENIISIEADIANYEGEIKNANLRKTIDLIFSLILVLIGVYIFYIGINHNAINLTLANFLFDNYNSNYIGLCFLYYFIGISILGTLLISAFSYQTKINKYRSEIEGLIRTKDIIKQFAKDNKKISYFDHLVIINTNNLEGYYKLVKGQTETSFRITIIMCVTGFVLIGTGLATGFTNLVHLNMIPYITSGSGIITEIISSIFFAIHSKNIQQMKDYYNNILKAQNTLFAFQLVENTKDENVKAKIIAMIASGLMDKSETFNSTK